MTKSKSKSKEDLRKEVARMEHEIDNIEKRKSEVLKELDSIKASEAYALGGVVKEDLPVLLKYIKHSRSSCMNDDQNPQSIGRCPRCTVIDAFAYEVAPVEDVYVDIQLLKI